MMFCNVALCCGLLFLVPTQGNQRAIQETIEYVQGLQTPEGGFLPAMAKTGQKPPRPSLRATTAGLRALKYFGAKAKNLKAARDFVDRCYDTKSGGFADLPDGKPDTFTTAVGLLALAEVGLPAEKYRDGAIKYLEDNVKGFEDIRIAAAGLESMKAKSARAADWIKEVRKLENPDGSFGKGDARARVTGAAVVTLLRLGAKVEQRANIIKAMKAGQQPNGGFGMGKSASDADLAAGYQVMRAFHMLETVPEDVEGLRTFVEKCRNEDGGYSVAPGEPSAIAPTYYAAIIHYWIKGK
jgi:prenyltransferase beta subunit